MNEEILATLRACEPGDALVRALRTFLDQDSHLLLVDANERSMTSHIARYLAAEFPCFHVDCEYNRDGIDPKKLRYMDIDPNQEDTFARTVFPDIIVHRRNTNDNYLVIEVKKSTNPDNRTIDHNKLIGYKTQLGYRYALFLELTAGDEAGIAHAQWF